MEPSSNNKELHAAATRLYDVQRATLQRRISRTFAALIAAQWVCAVVFSLLVTPRTWIGSTSYVHMHVLASIVLGGFLSVVPIAFAVLRPQDKITSHTIAIAQMLWGAILTHLTGGRLETHFHVFVSLAFLAFYRNRSVLLTATVVVVIDHIVRGIVWPQSIYGVMTESPFRWMEHAAWVLLEFVFLDISNRISNKDTWQLCLQSAQLTLTNNTIEQQVKERTEELNNANQMLTAEIQSRKQLQERETRLGRMVDASANEIYIIDKTTLQILDANQGAASNLGYTLDELLSMKITDIVSRLEATELKKHFEAVDRCSEIDHEGTAHQCKARIETVHLRKDKSEYEVEAHLQTVPFGETSQVMAIILDITDRKAMEREQEALHQELIKVSRSAGMAETATGILHNVGNVLNSVNVSASRITTRLHGSQLTKLEKAATLLQTQQHKLADFLTQDVRGQALPEFINRLVHAAQKEQREIQDEFQCVQENIDHIKEVIRMQQSQARYSSTREECNLATLAETAIRIFQSASGREHIEIIRDFDELAPVVTEKNRVLQIMINVLTNAGNALLEHETPERKIFVRIGRYSDEIVRIQIRDTGIGMTRSQLAKIFTHGFTTRKNGHGFGLHTCAVSAEELGGSLTASSEGIHKGASFTLLLPTTQECIAESPKC